MQMDKQRHNSMMIRSMNASRDKKRVLTRCFLCCSFLS